MISLKSVIDDGEIMSVGLRNGDGEDFQGGFGLDVGCDFEIDMNGGSGGYGLAWSVGDAFGVDAVAAGVRAATAVLAEIEIEGLLLGFSHICPFQVGIPELG